MYNRAVPHHDIPNLSQLNAKRVKSIIENKIMVDPFLYAMPLRATLRKCFKIRVGDIRIVFEIVKSDVLIIAIAPRKDVYQLAERRI